MRLLVGLAVLALALAAPTLAQQRHGASRFLAAIEDVPLMDGLVEETDPLVFESDRGRVVHTTATGAVSGGDVAVFYLAALPQLGWKPEAAADPLAFVRGNERLSLVVRAAQPARPAQVDFELIARLASTRLER